MNDYQELMPENFIDLSEVESHLNKIEQIIHAR